MKTATATIRNEYGIHCRPSAVIVKETSDIKGHSISVSVNGEKSDLSDIMGIMVLQMEKGAKVEVSVEGPDEDNVCAGIVALLERDFDFTP